MRKLLTLRARGQALIETAFALPVFLLALYGAIWALQNGMFGERVQVTARYDGMVASEVNLYDQFSLYAVYSAATSGPLAIACPSPAPAAIMVDAGPIASPAPQTPALWQVQTSSSTTVGCGRVFVSGGALSSEKILRNAQFAVAAAGVVPAAFPQMSNVNWSASLNHLSSPDVGSLVACYPELASAFAASVAPTPAPSPAPVPTPLVPATSALSLNTACPG